MVDAGCSRSGRSRSSTRSSSSKKTYLDLTSPLESYQDLSTLHKKNCKKYFCLCKKHVVSVICVNETRKLYWFNSRSVEEKISQGLGEGYYNKLLRIVNGALHNWAQRYIDGLGGFVDNLKTTRQSMTMMNGNSVVGGGVGSGGAGGGGSSKHYHHHRNSYNRTGSTGGGGTGGGTNKVLKINGSAKGNMKLLKEGCYCHFHPHITADVCNADFLRRVVSRDNQAGVDENDDFDALTPLWMVFF